MRRLSLLLLPLAFACETIDDRVNKDDPNAEITIKPDELEPMANFVLETNRVLVAEFVKIQCSAQFFEQQMADVPVPKAFVRRMQEAEGRGEEEAEGVRIARELCAALRPLVQGVLVAAPDGAVERALEVV